MAGVFGAALQNDQSCAIARGRVSSRSAGASCRELEIETSAFYKKPFYFDGLEPRSLWYAVCFIPGVTLVSTRAREAKMLSTMIEPMIENMAPQLAANLMEKLGMSEEKAALFAPLAVKAVMALMDDENAPKSAAEVVERADVPALASGAGVDAETARGGLEALAPTLLTAAAGGEGGLLDALSGGEDGKLDAGDVLDAAKSFGAFGSLLG